MTTSWQLEAAPRSAPLARRMVSHGLRQAGWSERGVTDAELVTSELISNAVRHGGPPIELGLRVAARWCRIEVSDGSGTPLPASRRRPALDELGGRGLLILDALSSRWGVQPLPAGKRVWVELTV